MKKNHLIVSTLVSLLCGLLGGLSSWWFSPEIVQAKSQIDSYSDTVSARIFRLVDDQGTLRAALCFDKGTKNPTLALMDNQGAIRAYITVTETGPSLTFRDKNEKPRLGIRLSDSGESSLICLDEKGRHQASLIVDSPSGPKLSLSDDRGEMRLGLALKDNKEPTVLLRNADGKTQAVIFNHQGFGPGLFIHDSSGQPQMAYTGRGPVDATRVGQGRN